MSSKKIWKFPFGNSQEGCIRIPANADIIHVGYDPSNSLCLWAICETEPGTEMETRSFAVLPTGAHIVDYPELAHLATVRDPVEPFIWHIFEVLET